MNTINNRVLFVIDDYDQEPYMLLIFNSPQEAEDAENYYVHNYECSDEINTLNLDEKIELITSRFNCEVVKIALSGDFTIQPEHKIYV